jgi:hypothetical protein
MYASSRFLRYAATLGILWCVTVPAAAGNAPPGWTSLFDGKSLAGWRAGGSADTFSVRDGTIVAHGKRSHLFYVGPVGGHDFRNFEFTAEVMTRPGANSGIYFHTQYQAGGWPGKGCEVQISNTHRGGGSYRELKRTGSLYAVRNVFPAFVKDNEWFGVHVVVRGRRIQIAVNGKPVVDYVEPDRPGRTGRVLSHGTFALQGHDPGSTVFFRKILVKPLPDAARPADTRSEAEIALQRRITRFHAAYLPLIDFHVHLKGGLTLDEALAHSRKMGIGYGVAPNCGLDFAIKDDKALLAFHQKLRGQPVFKGMQAEGREWTKLFSRDAVAKFDYVFTDAMTFTDDRGKRIHLWRRDEVRIDDPQKFMDMYLDRIVGILDHEPIDILANPTILPAALRRRYDELWTPERMDRVIQAARKNGVALEINASSRVPSIAFVRRAKKAGCKLAFGTNNGGRRLGHLEYCLKVAEACGLKKADMFMPSPRTRRAADGK